MIEKYLYSHYFHVPITSVDVGFLKDRYGKLYVAKNYNILMFQLQNDTILQKIENMSVNEINKGLEKIKDIDDAKYIFDDINNNDDNDDILYDERVSKIKLRWIIKIITTLGFNKELSNKIDKDKFYKKRIKLIKFMSDKFKILFNVNKNKNIDDMNENNKSFLGMINTILNNYGLNINVNRKNTKVDKRVIKNY